MDDLILSQLEIDGRIDCDGDCEIRIVGMGHAYLNKEEMQQVINHLTELLKG